MNLRIIIITFITLLNNCSSNKSDDILINVNVIEKIDPNSLKVKDGVFYSAQIELINNTDTILDFWTMSCSWESNWLFEDNSYNFFVECPKNVPIINQIKPFQKIIYNGIIEISYTTDISVFHDIRLGFALVKLNEVVEESDFIEILRGKKSVGKDIFWSEPFSILDH